MHPMLKVGARIPIKAGGFADIVATDLDNKNYPVLAIVTLLGGTRHYNVYTDQGHASEYGPGIHDLDLPDVPLGSEVVIRYVNVYRGDEGDLIPGGNLYDEAADAQFFGRTNPVAVAVPVIFVVKKEG